MATRAATHDRTGGHKPGHANGESDHDANRASGQPGQLVPSGSMPTSEGYIGDCKVKVLRDTGCSSAVVRLDLVDPSDLTGEMQKCVLMDGTTKHFPVVEIWVDTPYYVGKVEALGMREPMCDLVIGNSPWGRRAELRQKKEGRVVDVQQAHAVTTRTQAKRERKPPKPLKVSDIPDAGNLGPRDLQQEQEADQSLQKLRELAGEGREARTRGQGGYRYVTDKEVLYRVYNRSRGEASTEVRQIIVPTQWRKRVMGLAHETIVGGHLGSKKTLDRITTSFHWPGISGDVKRFCQSCDVGQKMVPKGRVQNVPLGEMPIMDAPFQRVAIDLIGPLSPVSNKGNRYILTVVDYATRYPEAIPLAKIDTVSVAEALLEVFSRVGFPEEILATGVVSSPPVSWKRSGG